ncbi:MAG: amidohydrolase family protein [Gammaproteobacteria bacterium]|nr:amidohydrolase [Gammaproteobacteria bacterium]
MRCWLSDRVSPWLARALTWPLALVLCACGNGVEPAETQATPTSGAIAFVGVNVVPMDREIVLAEHTVVVRDGRIVEVGPTAEVQIPSDAELIEARGHWLMPGLTEMHGHVPGDDDPTFTEDVLFLYVSNGVTTVRNMAGHPYHLRLRERIAAGEVVGPTLYAASPWLTAEQAGTPAAADRIVREYHAAGFDLIKLGSIPRDAYVQLAQTAHAIGMPFGGHIPESVGLIGALEARQTSIDHFDRYAEFLVREGASIESRDLRIFGSGLADLLDEGRIPEAVERTLKAGTWNVPTLSLVEHLASPEPAERMIEWPEMRYVPKSLRERWAAYKREVVARDSFRPAAAQRLVEIRRKLLKALHDAGAPIALGSDAPQYFNVPGFSIHREMQMMVEAGLTPYQVLETGTAAPARYFGAPEEFGTIAKGRRADLILLQANPLENIANVRKRVGVMIRGQWWPEERIQARLEQIAQRVATMESGAAE